MTWARTETGSALHRPECTVISDATTRARVQECLPPVVMRRNQAGTWLEAGERRTLCRTCMPADPRLRLAS